jgi:hypothetical protein
MMIARSPRVELLFAEKSITNGLHGAGGKICEGSQKSTEKAETRKIYILSLVFEKGLN